MDKKWYDKNSKSVAINIWAPVWYKEGVTKLDIKEVAKVCKDSGIDIVYMWQGWTQDHFGQSYFPTIKGPVHPNVPNGRSHVAELIDECHKLGIKVVAYYSFPDLEVWKSNADWRQVDEEGNEVTLYNYGALCPNSPYHEHITDRICEIVEKYKVDGICILDSACFAAHPVTCYCEYCKKKYKERFGRAIPKFKGNYDNEWEIFIKWRYSCLDELFSGISDAVKQIDPEVAVTHFSFTPYERDEWGTGHNYEHTVEYDDFINSITGWTSQVNGNVIRKPDMIWKVGFHTRYLRAMSGKSVHMHVGRFTYSREFQTSPEHEMRIGINAVVTAGGQPSMADNFNSDGSINIVPYDRIGNIYKELSKKDRYLNYEGEKNFVALYYSKKSLDYTTVSYPNENRYIFSCEGAYRAMVEEHIPFQIVTDRCFTLEALSKYKILVMPDAVIMDEAHIEVVKQYVKNGGKLIATSRTSLAKEYGEVRDNYGLSEVFGVDYINPTIYTISYIDIVDESLKEGIETREYTIIRGPLIKGKLHEGAKALAYLVQPATEIISDKRMMTFVKDVCPGIKTSYPAAVLNSYGKGNCIYFGGDITGCYGEYSYAGLKGMLINSIKYLAKYELPVYTNAPKNVEISWFTRGNEDLIHILNYSVNVFSQSSTKGGGMAESGHACSNILLKLSTEGREVESVKVASTEKELEFSMVNDKIEFVLPYLEVHEIIVIKYKL